MIKRIAIIGAGIGGLSLAHMLKAKTECEIVLFEKARGVGGRMSTRYAPPFVFDHGAQCFTARSKSFQDFLKPLMEEGVVAEWKGKVITIHDDLSVSKRIWFETHLVASPNMNSLCKRLAEGLDVRLSVEVAPLGAKENGKHILHDKEGTLLGEFDVVISTAPPLQTVRLFDAFDILGAPFHQATMQPCITLMVGVNAPWDKQWIAAKVANAPIKWVSVNSSKPGRDGGVTCLVAHARKQWSNAHIDVPPEALAPQLLAELNRVLGKTIVPDYLSAHRWKYALVDEMKEHVPYWRDESAGIAAVSDWGTTSRIEDVWVSALALAENITKKEAP